MANPNPTTEVFPQIDARLDIDGSTWNLNAITNESVALVAIAAASGTSYKIGYLAERPAQLNFASSNAAPAISGYSLVTTVAAVNSASKFYVDYDRAFIITASSVSGPVSVTYSGMGSVVRSREINNIHFGHNYLGPKSSAPSVDNEGNALAAGDQYYNTSENKMYIRTTANEWKDLSTLASGNTITSADGYNLTLTTDADGENVVINSTTGSSGNTILMPKVRASENNYVLAMSDKTTGETAWQATATAPTITSISGALNHDQDSTLTLFGEDYKNNTTVSLWNASSGGSQVGSNATITNQTATRLEATFGHGSLSAGATVYVEANTSGINTRFASAFTVSADPTVTFTQGTGSGANTTNHLGTYGGRVAGGPQDSNTKLLLNFDRTGGTDIEDSSNTGGDGHKVTATNAVIKASPFGDGKSAMFFDGSDDYLSVTNPGYALGSTWTIEMWLNFNSVSAHQALYHHRENDSNDNRIWFNSDGTLLIDTDATGEVRWNWGPSTNTWYHLAICSTSNSAKCFVNGSELSLYSGYNATITGGFPAITGNVLIGVQIVDGSASRHFNGYIDSFRAVAGVAVYSGPFTVPNSRLSKTQSAGTNISAITGTATKLLIHSNLEPQNPKDRTSEITVSGPTVSAGSLQNVVNGKSTNDANGGVQIGGNSPLAFDLGSAKKISSYRFIQSTTNNHGTVSLKASNNSDFSSEVTVSGPGGSFGDDGTTDYFRGVTHTTAYRYYRLATTGSWHSTPWITDISFHELPVDSSDSGHAITVGGSASHSTAHGGIAPALTFPANGKTHGSTGMYFDGNSDIISIPHHNDLDFVSEEDVAKTLDFWIYPQNTSSFICGFSTDSNDRYHLSINADRTIHLYGKLDSTLRLNVHTTDALVLNQWTHIMFARDDDGAFRLYFNGKYAGDDGGTRVYNTANAIGGDPFQFGNHGSWLTGSYDFLGYIDSVRVQRGVNIDTEVTTGNWSNGFSEPTKIYGAFKDKTIPTITFTGQLASGSLASDEDIEFSNVANTANTSGMQKLDDTKIGLTLTNLTGSDKNKATLTGTVSDDFSGTSRANLPVKAQVRTERGNAAYDSTGSSKRLVTFSSTTKTTGLQPGYSVTGTGIAAGTTITSIDSATTLTLSQDTTGGALTSQTLHFGDPERQIHVNGSEVLSNSDAMLTIAIDPETQPTLFNARRYVGSGAARDINEFGFAPDLVWIKNRDAEKHHRIVDSVRGSSKHLISNENNAESTQTAMVTSLNNDGFSVGSNDNVNSDNQGMIAWAWKAGGAPSGGALPTIGDGTGGTVTSGAGTIPDGSATNNTDIVQSVNRETGFSITKFNGASDGGTFPHNLGATPAFVIVKKLTDDGDNQSWAVWHKDLTATSGYSLFLNTDAKEGQTTGYFDYSSAAHSSTNISVGSNDVQGGGDDDYICYAWKAVSGVSAFGKYEGTGGAWTSGNNGGAQDVGFKPRFLITKNIDTASTHWMMFDSFREASDTKTTSLYPNLYNEENSHSNRTVIFDSNGFKFNSSTTHSGVNTSGDTYIYAAFA